jgi:hypothetical protein
LILFTMAARWEDQSASHSAILLGFAPVVVVDSAATVVLAPSAFWTPALMFSSTVLAD